MKMNKIFLGLLIGVGALSFTGCKKDWLERQPKSLIVDEQVWNDPKQYTALLANYYDRLPTDMGLTGNWRNMANYDDAMWSGYSGEDWRNNIASFGFDSWRYWDYGLIRDINLAIENTEKFGTELMAQDKQQFLAEFRFQRAMIYFELVRRMGGVPLVTKQLIYDFSGDPTPLQQPRAKEAEVYDFIASEVDAIKNDLGNAGSNTRANKYTALALKSRAMLYAASIAKYNNQMAAPIRTSDYNEQGGGGSVGIPASRANEYYQKSLEASKEILSSGQYSLYRANTGNLGENFFEAVTKKLNNREVIFAKDYLTAKNKKHFFSYDNIARGIREDNLGSSSVTPVLNLVESYEYLDGSNGALRLRNGADYVYYNTLSGPFENKDARLYGTVIYPGTSFKGLPVEIQAGVAVWNAARNDFDFVEGSDLATRYTDGKLLTGSSGPHRSIQEVSNTGFYLRKYIDPGAGTSTRGIQSDMWWVWFRLGEIYLNAAEAAFELDQVNEALTYINPLRERAGFGSNSLTADKLSIERIRNERRAELAFEDHRLWDLKRWRIAHQVWNSDRNNPNAMLYALYPYRVYRPGHATHDKYIFVKMVAPRFVTPRFFQLGNYYSSIDQAVLNNNPKITVRNPFH
jgi:starch-binding outer membrane protein, SusD/RagB family